RARTHGAPTLVTSYAAFVGAFGGAFDFGATFLGWQDLPHAVRGFFDNGGRRAYVARIAAGAAAASSPTLTGGILTRLTADTVLNPPAARDKARLPHPRGRHIGQQIRA